jgi:uncharacterized protein DUF87
LRIALHFVKICAMTFELPANFYLGKKFDLKNSKLLDEPLLYSARDLTTHAVIIGMTGSGKTGLGISLLEEAALDSIPALIIDPKGDLTNLLLTFPQLRPDDFLPWVDSLLSLEGRGDGGEGESSPVAEATRVAEQWKAGLAQWGIDGARIQKLRDSADFTIFTPGSEAGVPINILDALRVPSASWDDDAENLREKIQGIVSAVLGLIGVEADPLRSREHILLSHLIEHAWRAGKDMDVAQLILGIQDPPMRKLGVFDLDTFFPPKDRFELAMALNAILAAPSFEPWLKGEPFDVASFLSSLNPPSPSTPLPTGAKGKPRHAIFYIAHLSDAERLFFVSLLLEQVRSWMRVQSGTNNLRALLYFDEMFGYLPPYPHNPSTKTPLLYLLKNARAFGLGLVLATQNPIDLDYKALTNAGTWFIGKLQTQYDKARLLDGLQTVASEAGAALDREQLNDYIGALSPRVFLYHNIHQPPPIGFTSRWAMSYLKGPLTRPQIRKLVGSIVGSLVKSSEQSANQPINQLTTSFIPQLAPSVEQYYLPPAPSPSTAAQESGANNVASQPTYQPHILGLATVTFDDRKTATRHSLTYARLLKPNGGTPLDWINSETVNLERKDLQSASVANVRYAELPNGFGDPQKLAALQKAFVQYLYREAKLAVRKNATLKVVENPDENERDFRQRCAEAARAGLEAEQEKIKAKYAKLLDKLAEKLQKEQSDLSAEQRELEGRKHEEMWSNIESIASFLHIGGLRAYRPLSTAVRKRRQTEVTQADLDESKAAIADLQTKLETLRKDLDAELQTAHDKWVAAQDDIVEFKLMPRKSDIQIEAFGIAWRLVV